MLSFWAQQMAKKKRGPRPRKQVEPALEVQPAAPPPATSLGKKHQATLVAIFARPTRTNISWKDFVSLMEALGAKPRTSGGSAHSFVLNGTVGVFHRPHPGHQLYDPLIRRIRKFLSQAGVSPP